MSEDQVTPATDSESMYKDSDARTAVLMRNVTKSDTVDLDPWARALRCDTAGSVTFLNSRGESVVVTAQAGEVILGYVKRIMETGTDGTAFMAYYG
jgi:hypothetical protein